jgi:hypothetical protein
MTPSEYIQEQSAEKQTFLTEIHNAITGNDTSVIAEVEGMMGKQMILYKEKCYMKYGLSVVKKHMSLHCMPIYMNPALHAKYSGLLPAAKLQKGCINFNNADELPLEVIVALITDCASIDIASILENRKRK